MPPFAGQQSASTNNNQNPNTGFGFGFGSNNNNNNNHTANNNNNATNSFNLGFGTSGSLFGTTAGGTNAFTTTTTSTGFNFGYPTTTTNNNQTNNTGFGIVHTTNNNIANNNSNTFNFNDNNDESTFPQFHAISYTEANNNQAIHYQCITANSKYKDSSLEEYRYQYYLKNNLIKDFTKSTNNCCSKNEFIYSFHFFKDLNLFNSILSKQFDNERYSDFIIRFYYSNNNTDENVEIPPPIYTHKSIITYFSQVFKTMLQNVTMIESTNNEILIDLNEDDYDVFYSMIKSFYFKDVINCCKNPSKGVTSNYLFNLLLMYDKYGCDELKLPLVDYFMPLEECFLKPILENSYLFLNENKHLKRLLFNLFDRLMLNLDEKLWNYITSNGLLDSITVDILVPYLEEKLVPNAFPIKYESLLTSLRRFSFKSLQEGTELCTSFNCVMTQLLDKVLNTNYQTNVETTLFTNLNEFILLLPLASDVKIYYLTQTNNLCIRILNQVKGCAASPWGNPNPQTGFVFGPTPPAPFNTTTAIPPTFGATGGFGGFQATHSSNF
ncbi:hypothetical protein ABK040_006651 [Willaertia magna]